MQTSTYLAVSADPAVTYLAVKAGAAEAHPLWASLADSAGIGPAMTIRLLAGLMLVAAVIVAVEHDGVPLTGWVLKALTSVFAAVAVWNVAVWVTA